MSTIGGNCTDGKSARKLFRLGVSSNSKNSVFGKPIKWEIIGGICLIVLQAFLIAGLLTNRFRRIKAEEALRESEKKYRLIAENTADLISILDMNLRFTYVSPASMRLRGFTVEEAMEQTLDQVLTPESMQIALAVFEKEMLLEASGTADPDRTRILELEEYKKDGSTVWVEVSLSFLRDKDRKPVEILIVSRDITERKQAEEALRVSEEKYRKLVNTAPYGIQLTDLNGKIIFSNPAHHKIQGYADGELIGKFIWDLMADNIHREKSKSFYQKLVKEQPVPKVYFNRDRTKDGREIDVQINWDYIYNLNGEIEGIISIISDITDQKKLQTQLQQAQKMESIGSLAGGIAHDLNNILFPISGLSEMLLDDIPPDNPAYESIEQIHKSAQRGSDLVKQILAFSRQSNPQKLPIRIQPILKEVLKLARATIPMNIEITSHIKPDCGMVSADPTQVHQIAMNLITNAYHAVEENGGTINIELKETEFGKDDLHDNSMKSGKYACITVSDTGTGIDQTLIDKIFDPYFTTKEHGKGHGTGAFRGAWHREGTRRGYPGLQRGRQRNRLSCVFAPSGRCQGQQDCRCHQKVSDGQRKHSAGR